MANPLRAVEAAGLIVALALLWVFPLVVFPHPATNDAIVLSTLELPDLLAGLLATFLVLVLRRQDATVLGAALALLALQVSSSGTRG